MIIGLMGKKQSGKDTVAKILVSHYSFTIIRFTDPIKAICKIMFGWGYEHIEGEMKEVIDPKWGISPRQAIQYIGTEFAQINLCKSFPLYAKTIGRNIWSERLKQRYNVLVHTRTGQLDVVVPDTRFQHEVDCIHSLGGRVIRIERPNNKNDDDLHPSEKELEIITPDYTIINNSTISDLKRYILDLPFSNWLLGK